MRLPVLTAALAAGAGLSTILGLPAVMPHLLEAFQISHVQAGLIVTVLWVPHAITQGITGWVSEALGIQRLLRWTLSVLVALTGLTLLSPSYPMLVGLRTATGVATGASFVLAILYAAALSNPAVHRHTQSLVGSLSFLAGTVAYAAIPLGLGTAGWRAGYFPALFFATGALILAWMGPAVPPRPSAGPLRLPLARALRLIWSSRIPVLALAHLCSFGIFVVVAAWLTAYFVQATGLSPTASLYVSAVVLAAGSLGRFAGGAVLGRVADRALVMGALACSGGALAGLAGSPPFPWAPLLAFCVLGCCSLTYGSIFAMALGRRPPAEAGVAVSAVSFMAGLGGSTLPTLMGWLVDRTGSFAAGFALLATLSALAVLCLALLPPSPHAATWRAGGAA